MLEAADPVVGVSRGADQDEPDAHAALGGPPHDLRVEAVELQRLVRLVHDEGDGPDAALAIEVDEPVDLAQPSAVLLESKLLHRHIADGLAAVGIQRQAPVNGARRRQVAARGRRRVVAVRRYHNDRFGPVQEMVGVVQQEDQHDHYDGLTPLRLRVDREVAVRFVSHQPP